MIETAKLVPVATLTPNKTLSGTISAPKLVMQPRAEKANSTDASWSHQQDKSIPGDENKKTFPTSLPLARVGCDPDSQKDKSSGQEKPNATLAVPECSLIYTMDK